MGRKPKLVIHATIEHELVGNDTIVVLLDEIDAIEDVINDFVIADNVDIFATVRFEEDKD